MIMIVIQIVLVLFMMNTSIGLNLLTAMSTFFEGLMNISKEGIEFVFEIYKIKTAIISF